MNDCSEASTESCTTPDLAPTNASSSSSTPPQPHHSLQACSADTPRAGVTESVADKGGEVHQEAHVLVQARHSSYQQETGLNAHGDEFAHEPDKGSQEERQFGVAHGDACNSVSEQVQAVAVAEQLVEEQRMEGLALWLQQVSIVSD